MDDLVTWGRAQLDDDERVARAAAADAAHRDDDGMRWDAGDELAGEAVLLAKSSSPVATAPWGGALSWELRRHIALHDPDRVLRRVAADRAILDEWQKEADNYVRWLDRPDAELHARFAHSDYEYETTQGQRKAWDSSDVPPDGDGWERNTDAGDDGWERFDYTEESYWRRLLPEDQRGRKRPEPPRHIKLLFLPYAERDGYRDEWRPA